MSAASFVAEARKAVAALSVGVTAATGAGILTGSLAVLVAGLVASVGAALAAYATTDPRVPKS